MALAVHLTAFALAAILAVFGSWVPAAFVFFGDLEAILVTFLLNRKDRKDATLTADERVVENRHQLPPGGAS